MPQTIVDIPGVGQVEFPDGMTPEQINAAAAKLYQDTLPRGERPRRSAMEMLGEAEAVNSNPEFMQGQAKAGGAVMPLLMGMAGGAVGGPLGAGLGVKYGGAIGGALGAGLGSATGGALRDASQGRPITARGMLTEGAMGAAGQAAGPLIGKGIQKAGRFVGRGLVRASVNPSAAVRNSYGGGKAVADTILDERLLTGNMANRAVQASSDDVAAELRRVSSIKEMLPEQFRRPIRASEFADDLKPVVRSAADRARLGMADETANISGRLTRIDEANPNGIDLEDAQRLKREAQDLASRVYRARARGAEVTDLGAETNEAVAKGLRRSIEARVPSVAPENARTARLMGARQALEEAEDRPHKLMDVLAMMTGAGGLMTGNIPAAVAGAAAVRGLASPMTGAAAGIGVNQAAKAIGNPQVAKAALLATLLGPDYGGE